jgi:hypothetical protein
MKTTAKKISPALFGLTLLCFFLPFVKLSCQRQELVSLTGTQLATGKSIEKTRFSRGNNRQEEIPPEPLAIIALLSSVVGLGTSLIKSKKTAIAPASAGTIGFIVLLMLKYKIDDAILKQGQGFILVSYGLGFWLAILLFASATALSIYSLLPDEVDKKAQE